MQDAPGQSHLGFESAHARQPFVFVEGKAARHAAGELLALLRHQDRYAMECRLRGRRFLPQQVLRRALRT